MRETAWTSAWTASLAGDGREQGDRPGDRGALATRGRAGRDRQPLARELDAAAAKIGDWQRFVADADDLDRLGELPGEVDAALGPVDILVANTGGPPPAAPPTRARRVGGGLPLARAGPRSGGRPPCRHARARLGTDRQRRLQLDPRADPEAQPLQLASHGGGRLPEDALPRGRRRRRHRQHRRHRQIRHRTTGRQRRLDGGRRRRRPSRPSPPGASACPRSTATSSPSSPPTAPPTSTGRRSQSTVGCSRSAF